MQLRNCKVLFMFKRKSASGHNRQQASRSAKVTEKVSEDASKKAYVTFRLYVHVSLGWF